MGKVDCIVEMRQKEYNNGRDEGLLEAARVLLKKGFSVLEISQDIDLPIAKIKELENEIESSE